MNTAKPTKSHQHLLKEDNKFTSTAACLIVTSYCQGKKTGLFLLFNKVVRIPAMKAIFKNRQVNTH